MDEDTERRSAILARHRTREVEMADGKMTDGKQADGKQADEKRVTVRLEALDGYRFQVAFEPSEVELLMDEPEPLGEGKGPNASQVLSAAVGNCLSASLLFCLRKAKLDPRGVRTTVRTTTARNEEGHWRVRSSDVEIELDMPAEEHDRAARCLEVFEDYCVVTGAVREGIEVNVGVVDPSGEPLLTSAGAG